MAEMDWADEVCVHGGHVQDHQSKSDGTRRLWVTVFNACYSFQMRSPDFELISSNGLSRSKIHMVIEWTPQHLASGLQRA